jgi:glucose dehydrogenase
MPTKIMIDSRNTRLRRIAVAVVLTFAFLTASARTRSHSSAGGESVDWPVYGGEPQGDHYSALAQINRQNVRGLKLAWKFDAGESGGLETSPIVVDGVLYAYTATQKVIRFRHYGEESGTRALLLDRRNEWPNSRFDHKLSLRAGCSHR